MFSINKFIVEPIEGDRALRTNNTSGFAMIEQRTALKGFLTTMDANIEIGGTFMNVPSGATIYVKEERMFEPGWQAKTYKAEGMEKGVMIIDMNFVEFIG